MDTEFKERPMTESITEVFHIAGIDIIVPKLRKKDYLLTFIALKGMQHALKKELKGVISIEIDDDLSKERYYIIVISKDGSSRGSFIREDQMYL